MAKIFLSYRREDSRGVAGRIYDRLRGYFGLDSVFFDVDSVPPGADFPEYIESVLSVASQNPCADLSPKFCYNGRSLTYWRCRHVTPANHPQT